MAKKHDEARLDTRNEVEKNDRLAMWISGMLVIGLPFLGIVAIVALTVYLLFGRG